MLNAPPDREGDALNPLALPLTVIPPDVGVQLVSPTVPATGAGPEPPVAGGGARERAAVDRRGQGGLGEGGRPPRRGRGNGGARWTVRRGPRGPRGSLGPGTRRRGRGRGPFNGFLRCPAR